MHLAVHKSTDDSDKAKTLTIKSTINPLSNPSKEKAVMEITLNWEINGRPLQKTITDLDVAHQPVCLGRSRNCQVVVADPDSSVSRRHAEVFLQDNSFYLRNLSQNSLT